MLAGDGAVVLDQPVERLGHVDHLGVAVDVDVRAVPVVGEHAERHPRVAAGVGGLRALGVGGEHDPPGGRRRRRTGRALRASVAPGGDEDGAVAGPDELQQLGELHPVGLGDAGHGRLQIWWVSGAAAPPRRRSAPGGRGRTGRAPAGRTGWRRSAPATSRSRRRPRPGVPAVGRAAQVLDLPADRLRPPRAPRRRRARTQTVCAADRTSSAGSRPIAAQAAPTRSNCAAGPVERQERHVELGGEPGRERRRAPPPAAADDHRRVRLLHRLGQRRRVDQRVVRAGERVRAPRRRAHSPVTISSCSSSRSKRSPSPRERDAVRRVLGLEPARPEPELDPPAATSRRPARRRSPAAPGSRKVAEVTSVPEPDPRGLPGQARPASSTRRWVPGRPGPLHRRGSGRSGRTRRSPASSVARATRSRSS